MFSGPVKTVSATNIFARMGEGGLQFIVYSMTVNMAKPVAMVLALPVIKGADEKAVRFIDLEKYQNFFSDLDSGFPQPVPAGHGMQTDSASLSRSIRTLDVVQVGSFEASFVPTVSDFSRLDVRFQLPAELFNKMPEYQHFGFAVFKLKPGAQTVHPMAFAFPSARQELFFPTVHVHDGKVHDRAKFDHVLYCQPSAVAALKLADWQESEKHASRFMDQNKTAGIIAPDEHCYKRQLRGMLANKDTLVETSA